MSKFCHGVQLVSVLQVMKQTPNLTLVPMCWYTESDLHVDVEQVKSDDEERRQCQLDDDQ